MPDRAWAIAGWVEACRWFSAGLSTADPEVIFTELVPDAPAWLRDGVLETLALTD